MAKKEQSNEKMIAQNRRARHDYEIEDTYEAGLAGAAAKAATETEAAVAGGPATAGKAAVIACIIVLFIIAVTNKRNLKRGK